MKKFLLLFLMIFGIVSTWYFFSNFKSEAESNDTAQVLVTNNKPDIDYRNDRNVNKVSQEKLIHTTNKSLVDLKMTSEKQQLVLNTKIESLNQDLLNKTKQESLRLELQNAKEYRADILQNAKKELYEKKLQKQKTLDKKKNNTN